MPRTVDYHCENIERDPHDTPMGKDTPPNCDYKTEELFNDTEERPDVLPDSVCPECGGKLVKSLNVKNNCQVWGVNKI
jgi:ssDNA-binding Zn-finger/Zn-ribbon topoisomerase 1